LDFFFTRQDQGKLISLLLFYVADGNWNFKSTFFDLINELFMRIWKHLMTFSVCDIEILKFCRSTNGSGSNFRIGNLMNNWQKAEDSEFGSVS